MKRKRNIYDADDAARSKRLRFSAEERAAHAEKKAEVLGQKLEKAKAEVPKQYRPRIKREFDSATGKVRPTLHFEEEVRPRARSKLAAPLIWRYITKSGRWSMKMWEPKPPTKQSLQQKI